jgi:TolB-like protein
VGVVAGLALRGGEPPGRAVIAVSIFDNETGTAEYDRLVSGLSDLLVARLTELAPDRIAVVGNAAVLRQPRNIRNLKAVAAGVRADYVLLGQLQRSDSGFRFITHVIRLIDETHLKANRISFPDANLDDLEQKVLDEFERAVQQHVLNQPSKLPT